MGSALGGPRTLRDHYASFYLAGMFQERTYKLGAGAADSNVATSSPPGSAGSDGGTTMGRRAKVLFDATGGGNREKGLSFKATSGKTGKVGPYRAGPG